MLRQLRCTPPSPFIIRIVLWQPLAILDGSLELREKDWAVPTNAMCFRCGSVGVLPGGMAAHLFLDHPIEDLWPHLLESQDDIFEPLVPLCYIIDDWWS